MRKKPKKNIELKQTTTVITSRDIQAIAGEGVMATQLDLARAYVELGRKNIATQILTHVLKNGNADEQKQAKQLLTQL